MSRVFVLSERPSESVVVASSDVSCTCSCLSVSLYVCVCVCCCLTVIVQRGDSVRVISLRCR